MNWDEWEQRRLNQMLEAGIRVKGTDYEQYLLAEAYDHAAMRRRTRAEAIALSRQGPQRVSKTSDLTNQRKSSPIQPRARTAP